MNNQERNLLKGAITAQFSSTQRFSAVAGLSASHINRILRDAAPLASDRLAKWDELLNILRREGSAVVLVSLPVEKVAVKLKPGPGGPGGLFTR